MLLFTDIGPDSYENTYKYLTDRPRPLYGGHILAVAVKAALSTLDPSPSKLINSVHSSFIRPTKPGISVTYKVYDKKDGALFSHRSVSAMQEGKIVFTCFVSFKTTAGDNQAGKLIYNDQEKPVVPEPNHHPGLVLSEIFRYFPIYVYHCSPSQHLRQDKVKRNDIPSVPK